MKKDLRLVATLAIIVIALVLIVTRTLQDKGEYENTNPYAAGTERFFAK